MPRSTRFHANPYLLLALTSFFWSVNWVTGRAITGHVSPYMLAYLRWVVALAVMIPSAWGEVRAHRATIRRHWRSIAWLGFWGMGLQNAFTYVGLQYTTATNGVILNSSVPVMIVVLAWLLYRETITRWQALGVAISLAGILAIITRGDPSALARLSLNKGDLVVLVGMAFWAAYTVFLRAKPPGIPPLALLTCLGCVGFVLLTPLAAAEMLFFGGHVELEPATIAAILYIGTFPSFIAYVFWNRGVAEVGSQVAGVFMHLMPAFGVVLAWIFLGERLYLFHWTGIALILAGIALATRGERRGVPEPIPE
jgi:drug/metabolite transporter (DMT)-like permease